MLEQNGHVVSNPAILYFGTPVVLVSTLNEDGSANLAPMSSAWWLGWRCVLGFGTGSQTAQNLLRTRDAVLNLPDAGMTDAVNGLALTTARYPVPDAKVARGYRFERNKFQAAGVTAARSEQVSAPRVAECPVQMEATVASSHYLAQDDDRWRGLLVAIEMQIRRVHLNPSILMEGDSNRVDPDKWRPMIMSFQQLYGLSEQRLGESVLAQVPESLYRKS